MEHQVFYISGLGDNYDRFRQVGMNIWRLFGVQATLIPITWFDGGSLEQKCALIIEQIKTAESNSQKVTLVGESAGASLALLVAHSQPGVNHVLTLCGVAQPDTPISRSLRARAPALSSAVKQLAKLTRRTDLQQTSVRALVDTTVQKRYTIASHARQRVIWSIGHLVTIALCLTLLAPYMAHLVKDKS